MSRTICSACGYGIETGYCKCTLKSLRAQLAEANRKLQESERENKYLRFGVYEELNIAISAALSSKGEENG